MKVRNQLVLAFLLLAVLPLAGIVLYSYLSSQRAFRQAVEAESIVLAGEMGERLEDVRQDIKTRLNRLASLPVRSLLESSTADESIKIYTDLMARMADVGDLVDWFEFAPAEAGAGAAGVLQEPFLIFPSMTLTKALERLQKRSADLGSSGIPQEYVESMVRQAIKSREAMEEPELAAVEARGREMERLLGSEFVSPVMRGEEVVGQLKAMVSASRLLRQVLTRTPRDSGEIPFARDVDGNLFVESPEDRDLLAGIGVARESVGPAEEVLPSRGWMVVETSDPMSGLSFGVARPIALPLQEIGRTAFENLAYGMVLMVLALVGVLWVSGRMTRNLGLLTEGAEHLAAGDLNARVPLRSRDEFGRLARTFNRMAVELREHQQRLIEEERRRKEQEIERRLLEAENERRGRELEEARQFQLSLLPRHLPQYPFLEIAVFMKTAAEVGGDYYDFFPGAGGSLTAVIGDAAGHGLRAGTMVTVVKGLLTTEVSESVLPELLGTATRAIKKMNLGRMNMALTLARFDGRRLHLSAAGMPPALVYRQRAARVEEVALVGTPLGSMADATYDQWNSELAPGDTVLLMTDGFPELLDGAGEPLGYARVRELFAETANGSPERITASLAAAAAAWADGDAPNDDITFLVLRAKTNA
jgi:serine phosphatase RsbU (regulator of sigma subunit)